MHHIYPSKSEVWISLIGPLQKLTFYVQNAFQNKLLIFDWYCLALKSNTASITQLWIRKNKHYDTVVRRAQKTTSILLTDPFFFWNQDETFSFSGDWAEISLNVTLSQLPFRFLSSIRCCCCCPFLLLRKHFFVALVTLAHPLHTPLSSACPPTPMRLYLCLLLLLAHSPLSVIRQPTTLRPPSNLALKSSVQIWLALMYVVIYVILCYYIGSGDAFVSHQISVEEAWISVLPLIPFLAKAPVEGALD